MSYSNATMCDTDTDHLTCPRCGYAPEAEYIYVGAGCSQDEPVTMCGECGWDTDEAWCCVECGDTIPADQYWDATQMCEECQAEAWIV